MKTYLSYKESGVEWIGKIPKQWGVKSLKYVANIETGNTPPKADEDNYLDGKHLWVKPDELTGLIPIYDSKEKITDKGRELARVVSKGSVLVCCIGTIGKFGIAGIDLSTNQQINSVTFNESYLQSFGKYVIAAAGEEHVRQSNSVVVSILSKSRQANIAIPAPPPSEQQAIADFLDRKTAQIDTLIEKKQRELELLREMRDVMTQNAMRSSKAKNLKLGDVADWIKRPMNRQDEEEYERIGLYNRGRGIFHKPITKGKDLGDSDFFEIKDGDFVISGQFAWEGAVALAQPEEDGCFASHRYYSLRGKPNKAETAYLFSFFTTQLGDNLLNHHSRGAAGRNRPLNINTLLREKIPVPPLSMQEPITALIKKEVVLKKHNQKLVEFLQEYRTALISEVVTGKIDVRTAE